MIGAGKKKLVVVYEKKDELALNYLMKLVQTKDDDEETGEVVGTKDNSVEIIAWTEKVYLDNKKAHSISNKIIFLDDIKGVDKTIAPIMDVKYKENGIKYGISGNNAIISIDEKALKSNKDFQTFLEIFQAELEKVNQEVSDKEIRKQRVHHKVAKNTKALAILSNILAPGVAVADVAVAVADGIKDKKKTREMMFLFAITKFYLEEMEAFMNS